MRRPLAGEVLLALGCALLLIGTPQSASGEPTQADQAAADALFNEAQQLLEAGQFDAACPRFLESHRLDPAAGTLLNLGDCHERAGRTASAWGAFREAYALARQVGDKVREQEAQRRADALKPRLSYLTIEAAASEAQGALTITRGGREVAPGLWGVAVPVDPGAHAVVVSAPGKETWRTTVQVAPGGGTTRVVCPTLQISSVTSTPLEEKPPEFWSTQRVLGAALGSLGVASGVAGAVFGAQAMQLMNDSNRHCGEGDPGPCSARGVTLREHADQAATAANVMFIVGGVALVGGVVLFATAGPGGRGPAAAAVRVEAWPALGRVALTGQW
ncbi:tetratricopeptide repeat protein [Chondromyces crocatus]|uniref:PEGA domain-containing protein n=1 Tax=Chondromyces crocatus TaxID=52 RepID=A0A0K1EE06_CHOCO|nr:tetratricopeptide repeat protein [Chondromyces crocatus]AKT39095.1 uncharacterized protein CMC5_032420 [Chondromyces crocatus]